MKKINVKYIAIALISILLVITTTLGVWGLIPRNAMASTNTIQVDLPYTRINADGTLNAEGDYLLFGSYPQSEVKDTSITSQLTTEAGALPTAENPQHWKSYGYYVGDNTDNTKPDFMWYQDIEHNGEKYRGVYFTTYRPRAISDTDSYQDDNGYYVETVYWFKYEPIKWRILAQSGGEAFLFCESIIDSQDYHYTWESVTVNGTTVYANNYEYSNIRKWLNDSFYNSAFGTTQKLFIKETTVDNSKSTTNENTNKENKYICNNTTDNVFLISYLDAKTYYADENARIKTPSAYALSQGYQKTAEWFLRSPSATGKGNYQAIAINSSSGKINDDKAVHVNSTGIVPAIKIYLCDHENMSGCVCTCGYESHTYSNDTDTICDVCNYCRSVEGVEYTRVDDAGAENASGNYVYFGSYPQSQVADVNFANMLTIMAGDLPTAENSQGWTSYDCYKSDASDTDFVWYNEIEYNGEKYRGLYFTSTWSDWQDPPIVVNYAYWFKYEPIKWRVLEDNNNKLFLFSNIAIDTRSYYNGSNVRNIDGQTIYPNNYEHSDVRKFLNVELYDYAFSDSQKSIILKTFVDNSASTTVDNSASTTNTAESIYACNNTLDNLFLLSVKDLTNTAYGFDANIGNQQIERRIDLSDYVRVTGGCNGGNKLGGNATVWWTRSPANNQNNAYIFHNMGAGQGHSTNGASAYFVTVVPALYLNICDHTESTNSCVCTECGEGEHTYASNNDVICNVCYYARVVDGLEYTRVDETGKEAEKGEYIYFGSYPQSKVTNESILNALNFNAGALPVNGANGNWTSYGYYSGNGTAGTQSNTTDYMWYQDIEYNGEKYRGVYFDKCRPIYPEEDGSVDTQSNQDENGYFIKIVYWFKYEPLKWKIHTQSGGKALLISENLIDARQFEINNSVDYETSDIRSWLNGSFMDTAFDIASQQWITTTNVDGLNDQIFLLSRAEVDTYYPNETGKKFVTDYSYSQGLYHPSIDSEYADTPYGSWWLRSNSKGYDKNNNYVDMVDYVHYTGANTRNNYARFTHTGIVPVMNIYLCDHTNKTGCVCDCGYTSHTGNGTFCNSCGEIRSVDNVKYVRANANGKEDKTGSYLYMGSYPQMEIKGGELRVILNNLAGTLPINGNNQAWTSYKYYQKAQDTTIPGVTDRATNEEDYMWYIDLEYNGETYRGVYFVGYRGEYTTRDISGYDIENANASCDQINNGYYVETVYWFKYEPIKWQIITEESGKVLVLSYLAIDSQSFQNNTTYVLPSGADKTQYVLNDNSEYVYDSNGEKVNSNNYAYSTIKTWLNYDFYNTAFTDLHKSIIKVTAVDNSSSSTQDAEGYTCENTNNRVFLLSRADTVNSNYSTINENSLRIKGYTDYYKVQGGKVSNGGNTRRWWLRSPRVPNTGDSDPYDYGRNWVVNESGVLDNVGLSNNTSLGVVPAMWISLGTTDRGDDVKEGLTVGSYVVNHAYDTSIKSLAEEVAKADLDVMALVGTYKENQPVDLNGNPVDQEVDGLTTLEKFVYFINQYNNTQTQYYTHFFSISNSHGEFNKEWGFSIISKYPINWTNVQLFENQYSQEDKEYGVGHAVLNVEGRELNVFITKLCPLSLNGTYVRDLQMDELDDIVNLYDNYIIVGQFEQSILLESFDNYYNKIRNSAKIFNRGANGAITGYEGTEWFYTVQEPVNPDRTYQKIEDVTYHNGTLVAHGFRCDNNILYSSNSISVTNKRADRAFLQEDGNPSYYILQATFDFDASKFSFTMKDGATIRWNSVEKDNGQAALTFNAKITPEQHQYYLDVAGVGGKVEYHMIVIPAHYRSTIMSAYGIDLNNPRVYKFSDGDVDGETIKRLFLMNEIGSGNAFVSGNGRVELTPFNCSLMFVGRPNSEGVRTVSNSPLEGEELDYFEIKGSITRIYNNHLADKYIGQAYVTIKNADGEVVLREFAKVQNVDKRETSPLDLSIRLLDSGEFDASEYATLKNFLLGFETKFNNSTYGWTQEEINAGGENVYVPDEDANGEIYYKPPTLYPTKPSASGSTLAQNRENPKSFSYDIKLYYIDSRGEVIDLNMSALGYANVNQNLASGLINTVGSTTKTFRDYLPNVEEVITAISSLSNDIGVSVETVELSSVIDQGSVECDFYKMYSADGELTVCVYYQLGQ